MAWCRPGDKPLSEPVIVNLRAHICVTRSQWVKYATVYTIEAKWGIYVLVKYAIIGPCYGLSPIRRHVIICTSASL